MGHEVALWPGSLPDTGDVWSALIATDIYAQLSGVLDKERHKIGRTLVAVLDQTRVMTVAQLTAIQQLRAKLKARRENKILE